MWGLPKEKQEKNTERTSLENSHLLYKDREDATNFVRVESQYY